MNLHGLATNLHHGHLDTECEEGDDVEPDVVAHAGEHIDFVYLEFSGVDLIENLHEYKDLENVGQMDDFLGDTSFSLHAWHELLSICEFIIHFSILF